MRPVVAPASQPATAAARVATRGCTPLPISATATAAPNPNDPSVVRSSRPMTRKVMNTPSVRSESKRPIDSEPMSRFTRRSRG